MTMVLALTADVRKETQLTQLCIPVLVASGLDVLGTTVAKEGELMLRAFILVVLHIIERNQEQLKVAAESGLEPRAVLHKAEAVEINGQVWFCKACNSDREAGGLVDASPQKTSRSGSIATSAAAASRRGLPL